MHQKRRREKGPKKASPVMRQTKHADSTGRIRKGDSRKSPSNAFKNRRGKTSSNRSKSGREMRRGARLVREAHLAKEKNLSSNKRSRVQNRYLVWLIRQWQQGGVGQRKKEEETSIGRTHSIGTRSKKRGTNAGGTIKTILTGKTTEGRPISLNQANQRQLTLKGWPAAGWEKRGADSFHGTTGTKRG